MAFWENVGLRFGGGVGAPALSPACSLGRRLIWPGSLGSVLSPPDPLAMFLILLWSHPGVLGALSLFLTRADTVGTEAQVWAAAPPPQQPSDSSGSWEKLRNGVGAS